MKPWVKVYSDYICPFCFIGSERVKELERDYGLEVEWRGLELHPETPKEGTTPEQLVKDEGYIEVARSSVKKLADEARLTVSFPPKISNSRLALELTEFAREKGKFRKVHEDIFKAYWQDGRDIGDRGVLFEIAGSEGLDIDELEEYLESGRGKERLEECFREAEGHGVTGVPTFIIGEKKIVGVQPYDVFRRAVREAMEAEGL